MPQMSGLSRWWIGTVPSSDWTATSERDLPEFIQYARGQRELSASQFDHIQLVVWARGKTRLAALKRWLPRAHWEPTRSISATVRLI